MDKKRYTYRICPCHDYDVEGIQTWLEDMAAEGLLLEKQGLFAGIMSFERTTPQRVKYRLEAIRINGGFFSYEAQPKSDFLELAEEFGWEHICRRGPFDIFRSFDPSSRELNTDPEIQAMTLKKLNKEQISNFITVAIYLLIMSFLRHWNWLGFFYSAVALGPLATIISTILLLSLIINPLVNLYYLHKLKKRLHQGMLLSSNKPWRPFSKIKTACKLLPVLALCVCTVLWLHSLMLVGTYQDISEYPQDPPFVTLEDIAGDADTAEYENFLDYNTYTSFSRSVAPLSMEWRENVTFTRPDGSSYHGILILSYYETCGEWFARGLADDIYARDRYRHTRFQDLEAPDLSVDNIRVYENYNLYVLIQHDNIVVEAVVSLDDETSDTAGWLRWAEAMADMLLSSQ